MESDKKNWNISPFVQKLWQMINVPPLLLRILKTKMSSDSMWPPARFTSGIRNKWNIFSPNTSATKGLRASSANSTGMASTKSIASPCTAMNTPI